MNIEKCTHTHIELISTSLGWSKLTKYTKLSINSKLFPNGCSVSCQLFFIYNLILFSIKWKFYFITEQLARLHILLTLDYSTINLYCLSVHCAFQFECHSLCKWKEYKNRDEFTKYYQFASLNWSWIHKRCVAFSLLSAFHSLQQMKRYLWIELFLNWHIFSRNLMKTNW